MPTRLGWTSLVKLRSNANIYHVTNPNLIYAEYLLTYSWPPTPEGSLASVFCFEELHGIPYDSSSKHKSLRIKFQLSMLI